MKETVIRYGRNYGLSKEEYALHKVAVQQIRTESEEPQSELISRKELFSWYRTTDMFRQAYGEFARNCFIPMTDDKLRELRDNFSGRVYQDMAHAVIASRQAEFGFILSPERTLELYKSLYPNAQLIRNPFGLDSLNGISVPDGAVINRTNGKSKILAICEYTCSGKREKFEETRSGFRIVQEYFPRIFGKDPYLLIVVPKSGSLLRVKTRGLRFVEAPFTHAQLRKFIDGVCNYYTPNEDAGTLVDFLSWARKQYNRGLQYGENQLTPQYRDYLIHVSQVNQGHPTAV